MAAEAKNSPEDYNDDGENDEEWNRQNEAAAIIQRHWKEATSRNADAQGDMQDYDEPVQTEQERKELLIEEYRAELQRREQLLEENVKLQRVLSRHFEQKKQSEQQDKHTEPQNAAESENKYLMLLDQLRNTRLEVENLRNQNKEDLEIAREKMNSHQARADEYEASFRAFKRQRAEQARYSRTKKPVGNKKLDWYDEQEDKRNQEVKLARIGYIRMRNRAKKLADLLKEKEKLTDGLHLIDFEQLKIENTTLNEKIEERNEDLLKLKKKATTTIHILTHVKEKLQFIQGENLGLRKQLDQLDDKLDEHRGKMTTVKRDRDHFVTENVKMREKMPMIGSEDLLMDYEVRKKQIENLRISVVEMTNKHHELMQWIAKWQPVVYQKQQTLKKTLL